MTLSEDTLHNPDVLHKYHGAILNTHDNLALNDKLCTQPDTKGALKHPAWDRLPDNTPERWMEFYKYSAAIVPHLE